jgi:hypothetical protein
MKYLLTIGHQSYLLPSDKGVTTIMQTLCKAVRVWDRTYSEGVLQVEDDKPVEVALKVVPDSTKLVSKDEHSIGTVGDLGKKPKRPALGYKHVITPLRPVQGLLCD